MFAVGLTQASSTLIGKRIGYLDVSDARNYYKTFLGLALGFWLIITLFSTIFTT